MGNCCGKKAGVKYEVTFADGTKQTYKSASEAVGALAQAGGGGTYKAVAA